MKTSLLLLLCVLAAQLSSCAYATKDQVAMLGGKGAFHSKEFSLVYNGEKSFRDGALAAGTIATGYFAQAAQASADATAAAVAKSNAATAQKQIAADVAAKKIASDAAVKTAEIGAQEATTAAA